MLWQTMILRPHQIVLTVTDLDASVHFYSQFGFTPSTKIRKPDGRERITLHAPGADSFELKLFTNPDASKPRQPQPLEEYLRDVGTRYMSLLCTDVDHFYAQHKSALNFVRAPKTGMTGCRYAFITDPDGILLEIYQPADVSK
jgi:catechol 2,3-dioxygenase-like lactoylglutathione lyase family enzyme